MNTVDRSASQRANPWLGKLASTSPHRHDGVGGRGGQTKRYAYRSSRDTRPLPKGHLVGLLSSALPAQSPKPFGARHAPSMRDTVIRCSSSEPLFFRRFDDRELNVHLPAETMYAEPYESACEFDAIEGVFGNAVGIEGRRE